MTLCCMVATSRTETLLLTCDKRMAKNLKLSPNKPELLQKEVVLFGPTVKEEGVLLVITTRII